ncbi:hypothetical protein [Nocardioides sp. MH1]|uniref:hypothetical protein n=1 Tax=Nocardioides sp. MH1 TaxID=3242490 RepID=UPI003521E249
MATLLRALPLLALLLAAGCDDAGTSSSGDGDGGGSLQDEAVIHRDASVAWSADTDPEVDATDAVVAGRWVLVATEAAGDGTASVIGFDRSGTQWWERETGTGATYLTLLDDGLVRACGDGDVLDPTTGDILREGAACSHAESDDVYDVDEDELVVYDDVEHSQEKFRISLRDPDAVAWAVDGGVVTYSPSAHEVRMYR